MDAVVVGYPVANPGDAYEHGHNWFGPAPQELTRDFMADTPTAHPDRLAAVSPATYASADAPATFIVQRECDDFIPASGNYEVAEEAMALEADVSVVRVPFAHHGFDFIPTTLGGQGKLTIAAHWLAEHALTPPS